MHPLRIAITLMAKSSLVFIFAVVYKAFNLDINRLIIALFRRAVNSFKTFELVQVPDLRVDISAVRGEISNCLIVGLMLTCTTS